MKKRKHHFIQFTLWIAFLTTFVSGQGSTNEDDPIRVETNIVFVDVIVREKATRQAVNDLTRDDFNLYVDGKKREISNFANAGFEKCPLTLVLYFNLAPNGALRYLTQAQTQRSLGEMLDELGENDEVGVIATKDWFVGKPEVLVQPTREWNLVSAKIGEAVRDQASADVDREASRNENRTSIGDAVRYVESLIVKAPERTFTLIYVSDGVNTLDTINFDDRKALADRLSESSISFSALSFDILGSYSTAARIINPLAYVFGASVTGSANYLAEQTGGVALRVNRPEDLGDALREMIGLYASRYGLGFILEYNENEIGRDMKLEVKVSEKPKDGKKRKMLVSTRRTFRKNQ